MTSNLALFFLGNSHFVEEKKKEKIHTPQPPGGEVASRWLLERGWLLAWLWVCMFPLLTI